MSAAKQSQKDASDQPTHNFKVDRSDPFYQMWEAARCDQCAFMELSDYNRRGGDCVRYPQRVTKVKSQKCGEFVPR